MREVSITDRDAIKQAILLDKVIVYPTDTVYGIGCNAFDEESVSRVFSIKKRDVSKPLSVIAPSMDWIVQSCKVSEEELAEYLPGPYTIILYKRDPDFLSSAAHGPKLGVRMPEHVISRIVSDAGLPLVTTSANVSGEKPHACLGDVHQDVLQHADLVVDGDCGSGKPSTIVDLTEGIRTERL